MAWNREESDRRVRKHLDEMGEIEIKPYTREMDLDNLTETRCRSIHGAHVYAEIRNLSALVGMRTTKTERQELIQATHIYQREVARVAAAVGAERIVFQGGRVHLLVHHPVADAPGIADRAVVLQLTLDRMGEEFNDVFEGLPDLRIHSGSDIGLAIGTRNGYRDDRELLFLGAPANHAAKLLVPGTAARRLTWRVAQELGEELGVLLVEDGSEWRLRRPGAEELQELLDKRGIAWSPEACRARLVSDRETFPATSAGLWSASGLIDFDDLTYTSSRLANAATLYADVSGFTAYIDSADSDDKKREALRAFHAIRREMAAVVRTDSAGVRVQYQGDRVQALFNVPVDDSAAVSDEAVRAAVALQSSFEHVLKPLLPSIASLGLAVGVSRGDTIAAKLGERGNRDRICLGVEVLRAEANEENVGKFEIGISENIRDHLDPSLARHFVWDPSKGCHVAKGLDQAKLDLLAMAADVNAGRSVFVATTGVVSTAAGAGRAVRPSASHGPLG
jgi:hypothetical protein